MIPHANSPLEILYKLRPLPILFAAHEGWERTGVRAGNHLVPPRAVPVVMYVGGDTRFANCNSFEYSLVARLARTTCT